MPPPNGMGAPTPQMQQQQQAMWQQQFQMFQMQQMQMMQYQQQQHQQQPMPPGMYRSPPTDEHKGKVGEVKVDGMVGGLGESNEESVM